MNAATAGDSDVPHVPPLALYVHLPWCVKKCPYCDFNSHTAPDDMPRRRYIEALKMDIGREALRAGDRPLISVFLGGGTPSLFAPDEIAQLLDAVQSAFSLVNGVEITLEANPGTVECGDPAGFREAGINRLSIGAQSFSDASLAALGRIHTAADIAVAVDRSRSAGIDNINLDVMYALPGQNVAGALADLKAAVALEPEHISWYQLTLEPNTVFHSRPPPGLPDNDASFEIQGAGQALLGESGFEQYEISAYARARRCCIHNLNYWQFGDYLAVGAGAHGKLTVGDLVYRYVKPRNPYRYMRDMEAGVPEPAPVALSEPERLFEFLLNALRLTGGFDPRLFAARTNLPTAYLAERLRPVEAKGLIERDTVGWRPTELGTRFLNDLQAEFLPG